jgi:3-oxoacyl-[acyl-carrier protein] reductase
MNTSFDFSGKTALVTGSSRGIGAAVVRALDRAGARCLVNYVQDPAGRNRADAEQVAASLRSAALLECDVGDAAQVAAMMGRVRDQFGGLDFLVNNAGILRDRSLKKTSAEEWESVLRVNLSGAFHCIQQSFGVLHDGGRIVNLASVAAFTGFFGQANYASSKAGLVALTKVTARELARQKITANAVAPGFIKTDMTRDMPEEVTKQFTAQIPLGEFGEAGDIANAILFLCSDAARYITGQVIHVNGGFYM